MLKKIWVIAQRELYETYTDTNLLLIMLATPLALATIIGLALGGVSGGGSPITDIPVALVNQDEGELGRIFEDLLVPGDADGTPDAGTCEITAAAQDGTTAQVSLTELTNTQVLTDPAAARAGVANGTYAAAVIIPADFSEKMGYTQANTTIEPVAVEVVGDGGQSISAAIIRSVTEGIVGSVVRGNVTVAATIETLTERAQEAPFAFGIDFFIANQSGAFEPDFACAFDTSFSVIRLQQETLRGDTGGFSPLVYFGSAQAMFFMLFTAQGGATSILEDRRQGVLGRLVVSPTRRTTILLGKLTGTFISTLVQITLLFLAFTLVGSLINGELTLIWGTNWAFILLLMVAASLSVSGLGTLLAAIARDPEQANIVGSTINIAMGALGGAFFAADGIPALQSVQWLSLVYWGQNAFTTLAEGGTDIGLNVAVLVLQGAAMFVAGLFIFGRKLEA